MQSEARTNGLEVEIFSSCPPSSRTPPDDYRRRVADAARWSESAGCRGILIYSDNSLIDPWLVSQLVIESTTALEPLVAVQPVYMHPYGLAKMVATLGYLYRRRVCLNMVSGGFKNDLIALHDTTPHDERYDRLVEYTLIVKALLTSGSSVSRAGRYHRVEKLKLTPALSRDLYPEFFVSGSSVAGMEAARTLGATAVTYPKPATDENAWGDEAVKKGVRVGIIARSREEEAWAVAEARFVEDRRGRLTHRLAMRVSDSFWHRQLSEMAGRREGSPYWLVPFHTYQAMCPYLVGSYRGVGEELRRYIGLGVRTFILDAPPDEEELCHTNQAFSTSLSMLEPCPA